MAGCRPAANYNVSHLTRSRRGAGAGASIRIVDMSKAGSGAGVQGNRPTAATAAANTSVASAIYAASGARAIRGNVPRASATNGPETGAEVGAGRGARDGARVTD